MNVPKSYPMGMIDKRIINTSIKELTQEPSLFEPNNPIFKKLTYKKIRGKGRGRPVEKIEFYFMPETNEPPKEQKQNEKALQYIAQDIKKEQMLKELKRSSQEQERIINSNIQAHKDIETEKEQTTKKERKGPVRSY